MSEYALDLGQVDEKFKELAQELKDDGFQLEGAIRCTRGEEGITLDPGSVDTPDYEDQISEPSDTPTASLAGATGQDIPGDPANPETDSEESAPVDDNEPEYEDDDYSTAAAKEKAVELGLDISEIKGTGSNDRVTQGDVENAAKA